jgi:transcription elongation factor GreA
MSGKISDQSPVGAALIGHKKGDTITGTVEASGYTFTYRILNVSRD